MTKQESEMPFDQLDLKRAIAGDERAMQRLWSQHAPHIDAVVRRLCDDSELAADISQEVWMQIFRALPSYRGDSLFGTWAHRIAVNRTLNALRKIRRIAKLEVDIEDDSAMTEQDSDRTFVAESIEEAMRKLSPGARAVFVLHDIEGYTHGEIGEELGITSGGSKSQLFKARAKLRKLLVHLVDESSTVAVKGKGHVASV
ncbi:MAG TPA: RNA polymerase sigma factor [Gemmatimonadaceae bacterium]|nr:RNA polymerase sigma factor [Gemmatimonadaceae bacterium]